jgi:hypothetical protein
VKLPRSTTVAYLFVAVAFTAGLHLDARNLADHARDLSANRAVKVCNIQNIVRADRFIDTQDGKDSPGERSRVKTLFPLLDCEATLSDEARVPVPLPLSEHEKFISLVTHQRVPIVAGGRVVGSKPFPTPVGALIDK